LENGANEIIHQLVDCQVSSTNPELISCDPTASDHDDDSEDVISSSMTADNDLVVQEGESPREAASSPSSNVCSQPSAAAESHSPANDNQSNAAPIFDFITWMKSQQEQRVVGGVNHSNFGTTLSDTAQPPANLPVSQSCTASDNDQQQVSISRHFLILLTDK
jgi:hypothetical protein